MAAPISPEQAQLVLRRNVQNLVDKVKAGKLLTAQELATVEALADGRDASSAIAWARNQSELADALSVTRRTIGRWRSEGAPGPRPDGRWSVAAWREWSNANGKTLTDADDSDPNSALSLREARLSRLRFQIAKLEHEIATLRGEYTSNKDIEAQFTEMVIEAKKVLLTIPASLAPQVVVLTVPEAEKRIRDAIDDALLRLHTGTIASPAPVTPPPTPPLRILFVGTGELLVRRQGIGSSHRACRAMSHIGDVEMSDARPGEGGLS